MENTSNSVVLFSGGPDALITWELLNRVPDALYIIHNCKYEFKQMKAVLRIINLTKTDKIKFSPECLNLASFEHPDSNLPMRNIFFAMVATNMGYSNIHIAVQRGEQSIPDRDPEVLERVSDALSILQQREIHIVPYCTGLTKQDMVAWYLRAGKDIDVLKNTVSCFHPTAERCGACPACFRRWIAFEYNGIHEKYTNDVAEWSGIQDYVDRITSGHYESRRSMQTLSVLQDKGII